MLLMSKFVNDPVDVDDEADDEAAEREQRDRR